MVMDKNYLLPYRFKKIGTWMFIPSCAACLWLLLSGVLECELFNLPAIAVCPDGLMTGSDLWFSVVKNDPTNEISMLGLLVSLCFIALSKEKDEDEMTGHIRMQSFVWSFWVTAAVLAFGIIFIYGIPFVQFAFAAVFLVFILYILKFNLAMHSVRRTGK